MVSGFRLVPCEERLAGLKLLFLHRFCQPDDLITTFRIVNGLNEGDSAHFFMFWPPESRRGHDLRFANNRVNLVVRAFSERVANARSYLLAKVNHFKLSTDWLRVLLMQKAVSNKIN